MRPHRLTKRASAGLLFHGLIAASFLLVIGVSLACRGLECLVCWWRKGQTVGTARVGRQPKP